MFLSSGEKIGPVMTQIRSSLRAQFRTCCSSRFQIPRLHPGTCGEMLLMKNECLIAAGEYAMSAVGEANVVDKMIAMNAIFGGEGNGGPIHPQVGFVRDSFLGMALVLDLMARTGKKVSELAAELPQYAISKSKVNFERELLDSFYDELTLKYPDAQADTQDGLRLA